MVAVAVRTKAEFGLFGAGQFADESTNHTQRALDQVHGNVSTSLLGLKKGLVHHEFGVDPSVMDDWSMNRM